MHYLHAIIILSFLIFIPSSLFLLFCFYHIFSVFFVHMFFCLFHVYSQSPSRLPPSSLTHYLTILSFPFTSFAPSSLTTFTSVVQFSIISSLFILLLASFHSRLLSLSHTHTSLPPVSPDLYDCHPCRQILWTETVTMETWEGRRRYIFIYTMNIRYIHTHHVFY